jgi:BirA family biotin operon repressor/biotin-[acetyl-CoA-carboxylase] ligase
MNIDLDFISEIRYFKEISSTNDIALKNYKEKEFTVFVAETQNKGRGRNNRNWFSPSGKNLYFSFILHPFIEKQFFTSLPVYAAYSVFETLTPHLFEKNIKIKWPNDILVNGKKISGILIEVKEKAVIIGIGINVNMEKFPCFETNTPTSMLLETGKHFNRETILKEFFINFKKNYDIFLKEKKLADNVLRQINYALYLKNSFATVCFRNTEQRTGKIISITPEGFLKLTGFTAVAGDVLKVRNGGININE